jgi:hypothetical protein
LANSSTLPETPSAIAIAASFPLQSIRPYSKSSKDITSPALRLATDESEP